MLIVMPWHRRTNENTNNMHRQYFPKGMDLSLHSKADLAAVALALNTRRCDDRLNPRSLPVRPSRACCTTRASGSAWTARAAGATTSERLWGSFKYEEVYLHGYDSVSAAPAGIGRYLAQYNNRRPHSNLSDLTPDEAYFFPQPLSAAA